MIGRAHKPLALTTRAARPTYLREMVYAPDKVSAAF
jgi:hypothetical protein